MKQGVRRFFKYARDRHQIYLNREAGLPRDKWTADPIFKVYRFTNVFRELDRTTIWFKQNVRDKYSDDINNAILSTVVFRMMNRVETGEAIFRDDDLLGGFSQYDNLASIVLYTRLGRRPQVQSALQKMKKAIIRRSGHGPYVTGAYILTGPAGLDKLDGMLWVIENFCMGSEFNELRQLRNASLCDAHEIFKRVPYFGKFHSYEIVTDLRYTTYLGRAMDVNTWCNVGPGARRGLNRVMGRDYKDKTTSTAQMLVEMRDLLKLSIHNELWPKVWMKWEMREVEHTLCEFDKYERVRLGQGKPRGVYR